MIKRPVLMLALCALLFALAGWTARSVTPRAQWEYKEVCGPKNIDGLGANGLGAEGWELVATESHDPMLCLFFKRQK